MFGKKTVPLLILAMGMFLGAACGPDQEEYELPARPGEGPPGYEQPQGRDRPLTQPEGPMGEPEPDREFLIDEHNQGQGVPFDARPTQ